MRQIGFVIAGGMLGMFVVACGPSAEDRRKAEEEAQRLQQELLEEMEMVEAQLDSMIDTQADNESAIDTVDTVSNQ